jgi:ubiquinol-cytochrome c reductase iron-sulfur subunit
MANTAPAHAAGGEETRRDFLLHTTVAAGVVGAGFMVWPLVHSLNPAADTLSMSTTEFDTSGVAEGQSVTIVWRGKPVFVRHRTAAEIEEAKGTPLTDLPDPQTDADRVKPEHEQFLILVGVCTHLGCIPLGTKSTDPRGDFGGWFCPCHGSHYDTSGRIRRGPAPTNLAVPPYTFINASTVRIG